MASRSNRHAQVPTAKCRIGAAKSGERNFPSGQVSTDEVPRSTATSQLITRIQAHAHARTRARKYSGRNRRYRGTARHRSLRVPQGRRHEHSTFPILRRELRASRQARALRSSHHAQALPVRRLPVLVAGSTSFGMPPRHHPQRDRRSRIPAQRLALLRPLPRPADQSGCVDSDVDSSSLLITLRRVIRIDAIVVIGNINEKGVPGMCPSLGTEKIIPAASTTKDNTNQTTMNMTAVPMRPKILIGLGLCAGVGAFRRRREMNPVNIPRRQPLTITSRLAVNDASTQASRLVATPKTAMAMAYPATQQVNQKKTDETSLMVRGILPRRHENNKVPTQRTCALPATETGEPPVDASHYCALYHGPQISKDVWVWPKVAPRSRQVGAGPDIPADPADPTTSAAGRDRGEPAQMVPSPCKQRGYRDGNSRAPSFCLLRVRT